MPVALRAPGWWRALAFMVAAASPSRTPSRSGCGRSSATTRCSTARRCCTVALLGDAAVLPRRHRLLRLLVLLGRGRPTRPEDHSGHGAHSLEGLLPRQHRPQGDRHPVRRHLVLLPLRGRAAGDAHARRARRAGPPVRRRQHLQRPVQRPRVAPDLPVHHPGLRRAGELRPAADDRRAGHGLPAPERAVVLDAADRRHDDAARRFLAPGRLVRQRLDGLRAAERPRRRSARCSSPSACSSPARHRSPRR